MATLALAAVGAAVGSSIGGTVLGVSAAIVGQTIGGLAGTFIDRLLFTPTIKTHQEGPRLNQAPVMTSTEGAVISRGYGRFSVRGNVIWSTRFLEEVVTETQGGGKGLGGGQQSTTTTYNYYVSFAVGLCEGEIASVERIWADGKLLDLSEYTYRIYKGTETQTPDSFIETKEGSGNVPAYRGLAYIVFEEMLLEDFGNRIPQLDFEITRPLSTTVTDTVAQLVQGVVVVPGTTEFGLDPELVERVTYGDTSETEIVEREVENASSSDGNTDWKNAMDQLENALSQVGTVNLMVSWFGNDLRAGNCTVTPQVETDDRDTDPISWTVAGLTRDTATVVTTYDGRPASGGSPNDLSVYRAIQDLTDRGFTVYVYPHISMDIEEGNTLPNPYSDSAAGSGQLQYPDRGRITVSPAKDFVGSVWGTATASTQISTFLGTASAANFSGSAGVVTYSGTAEWSYRRFILHVAELCRQAGGVDGFYIGSGMVGLTSVEDNSGGYPFVSGLVSLAAEVNTLLGSTNLSYAANWDEYHSTTEGSKQTFNLDPLWSDSNIDFVGINYYVPLSDWRDEDSHEDYGSGDDSYGNPRGVSIYDIDYLKGQIEGGEYFDYEYSSANDRVSQTRTALTDTVYGQDWVKRYKDLKSWWGSTHYNRSSTGLQDSQLSDGHTPSTWTSVGSPTTASDSTTLGPFSDAIKVSSGGSVADRIRTSNTSVGLAATTDYRLSTWLVRDPDSTNSNDAYRILLAYGGAAGNFETRATSGGAPTDTHANLTSVTEVDLGSGIVRVDMDFTSDAADSVVNIQVGPYSGTSGDSLVVIATQLVVQGSTETDSTDWVPESKQIVFAEFGCPAMDKGTNAPDTFYDPQSGEVQVPPFSSGGRDDEIQRQFIRAIYEYWADNDPDDVVDLAASTARSYDARPWPSWPADGDRWNDRDRWTYGHWLSGRLDTVYVPDLLAQLAEDYEVVATTDFSRAYGSCDGFVITANSSFRSTVEPLASMFLFDIIESGETLKAVSNQETYSVRTLTLADISDVSTEDDSQEEPVMLTTSQASETPGSMTIQFLDIDNSYEVAAASDRRELVGSSESEPVSETPVVMDYSRAQQIVSRLLYFAWARRTLCTFGVLPNLIELEPGDVVTVNASGINRDFRIERITDSSNRRIEARSFERSIFYPGGTTSRTTPQSIRSRDTAPVVEFMDLPMLSTDVVPHAPYVAGYSSPWPGTSVYRSVSDSDYIFNTALIVAASLGETTATFNSGPTSEWDRGNVLSVKLYSGSLISRGVNNVLGGLNSLAIETSTGWEIVQFVTATLTGSNEYDLTQLLRGQLGTEDNIEASLAAGARVVVLDRRVSQLSFNLTDIGREFYYRYGPSSSDIGDSLYQTQQLTFEGRGLKPFSPVHITSEGSSDITISWVRRDRLNSDNWDYLDDIPLNEASELYEVDVLNGSEVVVRTLTSTSPEVTYTSAQQATDGISTPFDVIVYQISDQVGRGIGRRQTIG